MPDLVQPIIAAGVVALILGLGIAALPASPEVQPIGPLLVFVGLLFLVRTGATRLLRRLTR